MYDIILFAQGVARADFFYLIADGKAETSAGHVCDLGMLFSLIFNFNTQTTFINNKAAISLIEKFLLG